MKKLCGIFLFVFLQLGSIFCSLLYLSILTPSPLPST
jgi:hypothetical protein